MKSKFNQKSIAMLFCSQLVWFSFAVAALVLQPAWAGAQEPDDVPPAIKKTEGTPSTNTGSKIPVQIRQDFIYLPDAEGEFKAVPVNVTLENYLDWLDEGNNLHQKMQPAGKIQNLICKGVLKNSANGLPWAFLSCQFEIKVRDDSNWQFLILNMPEATLSGMTEKEAVPKSENLILTRQGKENRWVLWYRNRKEINATLNVLVPLQVTGDQKQLAITFPEASRTELQLQSDQKNIAIDLKSKGFSEIEQNKLGTLITVKGFNQLVDLLWSPQRKKSDRAAVFNVDSKIDIHRSSDSTTIFARQAITMEQGKLDSIKIRIPASFNIDDIKADSPIQYSIGTDRSLITLHFQKPVEKKVQIDWVLKAPVRRFESELLLEGFKVEGAKTETGNIGVQKSNDWRIGQIPSKSKNIYQLNVRDLDRQGEYLQAFRYYGQPWQLALATQRNDSKFSLETFYDLQAQQNVLKLTVDFEITPKNGTIDAVRLQWAEFDSDLWTLEEIIQGSNQQPINWSIDGSESRLLELPNWDKKDFIRLVASRAISAGQESANLKQEKLPFTLPEISVPNLRPGSRSLKITSAPGRYNLSLEAAESENLRPENIPAALLARALFRQPTHPFAKHHWYSLTSTSKNMSLHFEQVIRKIDCESQIQLAKIVPTEKKATYYQSFRFTVPNLPLNQIVLQKAIPHSSEKSNLDLLDLKIVDQNGKQISFVQQTTNPLAAADQETDNLYLVINLEKPLLGEFEIAIQANVLLSQTETAREFRANLPVFRPLQVDTYRVLFHNLSIYQIEPKDDKWSSLVSSKMNEPTWQGDQSASSLRLALNLNQSRSNEHVGFIDGQINTWIAKDGTTISELSFELARSPAVFIIGDPENHQLLSAYWSPAKESEKFLLTSQKNPTSLSLLLPTPAIDNPGRLIVTVQHQKQSLTKLVIPQHSLSQYMAWLNWRVHLPDGIYLFSPPKNFSPNYSWRWKDWGFRRVENITAHQNRSELTAVGLKSFTNSYSYTSIGGTQQIEFRCIRRGLLMAIGTGIPLLIAVFFTGKHRDNKLRGALLLFAVCGAVMILFPEQMAVLAQPALIGIFFTLLATWVAGKLRSHQEDPTLIIVGPSNKQESEQSPEPSLAFYPANADEVTRVQPPPLSSLESSQ